MLSKVTEQINKNHMIDVADVIYVGVSGGADSICLLLALNELKDRMDFELRVIHVDHSIRGRASVTDANYVKKLCKDLGVYCKVYKVHAREYAKEKKLSLEEAARILRYDCFKQEIEHIANAKIAVAHHREDVAETVLFNMIRGAGIDGLCGIRPVNGNIIRPLITCSRQEIEEYLLEKNIKWREDITNQDETYSRNAIRAKVIPELTSLNPKAVEHILKTTEIMTGAAEFVEEYAKDVFEKYTSVDEEEGTVVYKLSMDILGENSFLINEAIHKWLIFIAGQAKDLSYIHVSDTRAMLLADCGKKLSLPYGITVCKREDAIVAYKGIYGQDADPNKMPQVCFSVVERTPEFIISKYNMEKDLDFDKIDGDIEVRTRKRGDYLVINADGGTKRLSDYFIDKKIPQEQRDYIPLICVGSKVLVVQDRISEDVKITSKTKRVLKVEYLP